MKVAVIGATGHVGGRLVPELLAAGHDVRCLARNPDRLGVPVTELRAAVIIGSGSAETSTSQPVGPAPRARSTHEHGWAR